MRIPAFAIALLIPASAAAQSYQTDFPAEEFRSRHARVFEQIGTSAVAVVQGVSQTDGYTLPRQHNTFYYLMAVHDVGSYAGRPLLPGQVFSIDPQLRVPEENLYLRYEDTIVVTDTGFENFTDFLPIELDDMERLVLEKGVVQKVPPTPAAAIPKRR